MRTPRRTLMRTRLPNGSRLSCGAKRERSQTEVYNTAFRASSKLNGDGRRQLQAHVRQPRSLSRLRFIDKIPLAIGAPLEDQVLSMRDLNTKCGVRPRTCSLEHDERRRAIEL